MFLQRRVGQSQYVQTRQYSWSVNDTPRVAMGTGQAPVLAAGQKAVWVTYCWQKGLVISHRKHHFGPDVSEIHPH